MNFFLCKTFDKYSDKGILIVRLLFGLAIFSKGLPKLMEGQARWEWLGSAVFGDLPLGLTVAAGFIAALSEALGGLLLFLGLFTRTACVFLILVMLGALLYHISERHHMGEYFEVGQMLVVFFMFLCTGAQYCSLDKKLGLN